MVKNLILGIAIVTTTFAACNGSNSNENKTTQTADSTIKSTTENEVKKIVPIKEIVSSYLELKKSLTEDNTEGAATAGKSIEAVFKNFDKSTLTTDQKKTFEDVEDDAREHAEHIGANGGNIVHQREHFEMLSKDIYDLIKAIGAGQVLYKDFCPMYNNKKGAFWLSETKEIINPYLGKAMPTCGSIKEELK
ncbi:MAG: DUF3347 domain-containing protein [Bacteroidales bacterium]